MNILAIETSDQAGSLAALFDGRLIEETMLDAQRRSAQTLAPALRQLLGNVGWAPADVGLIAVAAGPGSFTGLRVGITTAKTFAYATGAAVVSVNTLEAIAQQAEKGVRNLFLGDDARVAEPEQSEKRFLTPFSSIHAVIDAQRGQVFAASFASQGDGEQLRPVTARPTEIMDDDRWLAQLRPGDVVIGPVLKRLSSRLPQGVIVAPEDQWAPRASTIGQIGWRLYQAGERADIWRLTPQYYRPSAAEENLMRQSDAPR